MSADWADAIFRAAREQGLTEEEARAFSSPLSDTSGIPGTSVRVDGGEVSTPPIYPLSEMTERQKEASDNLARLTERQGGASDVLAPLTETPGNPFAAMLQRAALPEVTSLAMNTPELKWAVPGLIPEGLTIFAGGSKLGKSYICLDLSVAVASGGMALGAIPCEQGNVLYVAGEDTARRVDERMTSLLGSREDYPWDTLHLLTTEMLGNESPGAFTAYWAQNVPNPRMLILDTKARVIDRYKDQQTVERQRKTRGAYQTDYDDLVRLHEFCVTHGIALVLVTHTNQMRLEDGEDWFVKIQGTTGIPGAADGAILLDAKRGAREGALRATGRDLVDTEMAVYRTGPWWQITDGVPMVGYGERSQEIAAFICSQPEPVRAKDIGEKFGMPKSIGKYLQRLSDAGKISQPGRGLYWKP